ncbi:response regulator [Terriglobus albidus]|uniref:response regulator n=1 Tax=Terriglobus albidus TaxID=1592106 RepID=UPI0021E04BCC|nr:response regulator [Terriglobus albidus]
MIANRYAMAPYVEPAVRLTDGTEPSVSGFSLPESNQDGSSPAKFRVLVVDDEKLLADTTAAILRGAGFEARAVYGGWQAVETARSFQPDCLLTDVKMPEMNGIELALVISKMLPATTIVLFSGQAGITELLDHARDNGYEYPLLAKPVHPLALIERLKELAPKK